METALEGKSPLIRSLPAARGDGWAAIFAGTLPGTSDPIVPRIAGALSLYQAQPGWYFPVGSELAVPDDMKAQLLGRLAQETGFRSPAIIVPRFAAEEAVSSEVDIYPVHLRREMLNA
ncbi:hypothetical protein [uncultured Erythrobacter sp.]|uniref:hypothetical protein n=1 Tax=uncultured Erythrobacter sp. TaxID=263913 RepID=UPI0026359664|nr:hypothetical protein [uncultured Erythrobacter sp.]